MKVRILIEVVDNNGNNQRKLIKTEVNKKLINLMESMGFDDTKQVLISDIEQAIFDKLSGRDEKSTIVSEGKGMDEMLGLDIIKNIDKIEFRK